MVGLVTSPARCRQAGRGSGQPKQSPEPPLRRAVPARRSRSRGHPAYPPTVFSRLVGVLGEAKAPYLYAGGHDPGPEYWEWLSRELLQAEVTVWPGTGHFPHLAQPERFAGRLATNARPHRPLRRRAARRRARLHDRGDGDHGRAPCSALVRRGDCPSPPRWSSTRCPTTRAPRSASAMSAPAGSCGSCSSPRSGSWPVPRRSVRVSLS
jgi:hypothetical protein